MPIWTPAQIQKEAERIAGRGLRAGAIFYANLLRQTLSVPAPRVLVHPRDGGAPYYRATTPAIPGAPPRKLSGRLRASVAVDFDSPNNVARVGTSPIYGPVQELKYNHQYFAPTLQANLDAIGRVIGHTFVTGGIV